MNILFLREEHNYNEVDGNPCVPYFFNRVYNKPTTNLWKSYLHTWIMSHYYSQDLLLILTRINRHDISINNSDGSPSGSWHKVTCDLEKNNYCITASVSWYHSNLNCAWSSRKYPQPSHRSFCGLNPPTTISSITTLQLKAKYEIQKSLNLSQNIVLLHIWANVSHFSPGMINFLHDKNICCGSKKVVAKSRVLVYFEHLILALLLAFHQHHNLSWNKLAHARIFVIVMPPSWILTKQINQAVHCISSTNVFGAPQVHHTRWKMQNFNPKLATKQCCATSWGFLYLLFHRI